MKRFAMFAAALVAILPTYSFHIRGNSFSIVPARAQAAEPSVKFNSLRDVYYGDLHLHTSYSLDAYIYGATSVDPDEAYRFARGEVVNYLGQPVQRREPLDFLAVTDHAENIGVFNEIEDQSSLLSRSPLGKSLKALLASITGPDGRRDPAGLSKKPGLLDQYFTFFQDYLFGYKNKLPFELKLESTAAWAREIEFANRNYEPGRFTTFIAYEWTATPFGANLHRNVLFKGNSAPYPFTSFDSKYPEDLWHWLEEIRKQGFEALAIPHNGNASNGLMYDWVTSGSSPIDRTYAEQRQANEPLSEIAQIKGSSETHPLLSPNDEFADYEIYDFLADPRHQPVRRQQGSYLRDALSRGLVLEREIGANPYKYGFVGGSDLHSGLSVSAQADYGGSHFEVNLGGGRPTKDRSSKILSGEAAIRTTSGNLTGVWAESNTRDSIYSALRRRETFATSGTKLRFRFFGGWDFGKGFLQTKNWVDSAYARGVPMGSDLPAKPKDKVTPTFAIWAVKDPNNANLDRVQVIKVWEEDGKQREKVFDVAWSGQRSPDPRSGKLPGVGNTADLKAGKYTNTVGAVQLETVWKDPDFNPRLYAAYYLRVLEIPTPRWSTLLAIHYGLPLPKEVPATEEQRGWSSPIWYSPPAK